MEFKDAYTLFQELLPIKLFLEQIEKKASRKILIKEICEKAL